ncbi:CHASE2 domain-containing sensor protein [Xanthomonas campestris]|nr:CHASE2 domain-containing sensor protein [Xanthomonas sp. CFBP 8151]
MTWFYLLTAAASSLTFYLATRHQRLWPQRRLSARALRIGANVLLLLSLGCAMQALGTWAGVFAAVTALMLVAVALPYLDTWQQARAQRRQVRDVG